ncbi:MAG: hypothetical protein CBC70_02030 [Alphaproteobacteria bacterium TMED110]|nr:MAG: hypothetical protein CBC70_02030 [Alphaproteobacteria bacterium TMED110]
MFVKGHMPFLSFILPNNVDKKTNVNPALSLQQAPIRSMGKAYRERESEDTGMRIYTCHKKSNIG